MILYEEEEKVHKPVEVCSTCDAVLYDGDEYVLDNCGQYYCDYDCAYKMVGTNEVEELKETDSLFCEGCGDRLNPEFIIYKDCDGDCYCSKECIDDTYGFEHQTLEYLED